MAFDNSLPADNTKIRNGPSEIRANFQAIEEALSSFKPYATNLIDRTAGGISPETPNGVTSTSILYSKQDADSNPQLFVANTNASPSTTTYQLTGNGNVLAWANFNGSTAVLADSFNIASVTRNSVGNYTIAFTSNLANANYGVIVTPQMTSAFTTGGIAGVGSLATTGFNLFTRSLTAASGTDLNPVCFVVIGT